MTIQVLVIVNSAPLWDIEAKDNHNRSVLSPLHYLVLDQWLNDLGKDKKEN